MSWNTKFNDALIKTIKFDDKLVVCNCEGCLSDNSELWCPIYDTKEKIDERKKKNKEHKKLYLNIKK